MPPPPGSYRALRIPYPEARNTEYELRNTLRSIAELVARQRAAILARDTGALNHVYEALLPRLADLELLAHETGSARPGDGSEGRSELRAMARDVKEQIAINRTLLRSGLAVADHFMAVVRDAASSQALFTGVG